MSYQIQEFKINNTTAYLNGVDIKKHKTSNQPASAKSLNDFITGIIPNTPNNNFIINKISKIELIHDNAGFFYLKDLSICLNEYWGYSQPIYFSDISIDSQYYVLNMKSGWGTIAQYNIASVLYFNENDEIIHNLCLYGRVVDMVITKILNASYFKVVLNKADEFKNNSNVYIGNYLINNVDNYAKNTFNYTEYKVDVTEYISFEWIEGRYFKSDGLDVVSTNFFTSEVIPYPEDIDRECYYVDFRSWERLNMGGLRFMDSNNNVVCTLSYQQDTIKGLRLPVITNAVGFQFCRGSLFESDFKFYKGTVIHPMDEITETNKLKNKKYIALGDSVTIGGAYTSKVVSDTGLALTNLGEGGMKISGDGSTGVSGSIKLESIPLDADVITLNGGINDWYQSVPLGNINDTTTTTFYGAMNVVCEYILTNIPSALLLICSTTYGEMYNKHNGEWNNAYENTLNLTTNDYGDAMIEVAKKYNLHYVDTGRVGYNNINIRTYMKDDGGLLHPNSLGGNRIGAAISAKLMAVYSD